MTTYRIDPRSLPDGDFAAAWFDDAECTWDDDRLHKVGSLAASWEVPKLKLFRPERGVTEVLFNPNAIAVSLRVRDDLRRFSEIEFLPIAIDGYGAFFIPHVTATVTPGSGFSVRRAPPPSGNIVALDGFPVGFVPPAAFFRVQQPSDSAGGRAGYCLRGIFASSEGADAIGASCGTYLDARPRTGRER